MAQIILPEDLSRRLRELAERQNRSVEEVLEQMLDEHTSPLPKQPDDMDTGQFRRKLYHIAREYWRKAGDEQRLALTDEQLDEQFWLIDHGDV